MSSTKPSSDGNHQQKKSGNNAKPDRDKPLLQFCARNINPSRCPFTNSSVSLTLFPSACLHLSGPSGAGKTTLANYLAQVIPRRHGLKMLRETLGIEVQKFEWRESIPEGERVGMLFQQTTLLDSLTVAGNVCLALEHCPSFPKNGVNKIQMRWKKQSTIKRLLETVGLDYLRDGRKRPSQLSGGMARRAALALQLAQRKHVIVLDEPFAGLDFDTAVGVATELERLRRETGTALLLISHEPELVDIVVGKNKDSTKKKTRQIPSSDDSSSEVVYLHRRDSDCDRNFNPMALKHPSLFGKDLHHRYLAKLLDYFIFSLPLILLTFLASGLAISMLSSDILRRVDVTEPVLSIVETEVQPLIKMVTGEESVSPLYTMMIKMKVRGMLNATIPPAKATLYALGMAKLFTLEIGPLITALLLSGRIGGSYTGEVATMQATAQNKLLTTLGISPVVWTFVPSLLASWLASPALTMVGTALALQVGAIVGPWYGIGDYDGYHNEIWGTIFMPLRLRGITSWKENDDGNKIGKSSMELVFTYLDMRSTHSDNYMDAVIEVVTHPVFFHLIKSVAFITIVMCVAEITARRKIDLTPKDVPKVITMSIVGGSLLVIFADWGFSQLLLRRH